VFDCGLGDVQEEYAMKTEERMWWK